MFELRSTTRTEGITGERIIDFLLHGKDADYQRWWPGTHLHLLTLVRRAGDIGNVIYMDEMIGNRRLKMKAIVREVIPGKKLVWQMKALVALPIHLVLEFEDDANGVNVTHSIRAGFEGAGRLLDPILRLYMSKEFARMMDEHVRTEFPRLARILVT